MENINKEKLISKKKMSLLIVIIHREKTEYYLDALKDFNINMQMVVSGNGTTKTTIYLDETGTKSVIFNMIDNDMIKPALQFLEEKFETLKDGKGVAYTVPLSKVMGVQFFNLLINNKAGLF